MRRLAEWGRKSLEDGTVLQRLSSAVEVLDSGDEKGKRV